MGETLVEQGRHVVVGQPIDHTVPVSASVDQASITEKTQLVADAGLTDSGDL